MLQDTYICPQCSRLWCYSCQPQQSLAFAMETTPDDTDEAIKDTLVPFLRSATLKNRQAVPYRLYTPK